MRAFTPIFLLMRSRILSTTLSAANAIALHKSRCQVALSTGSAKSFNKVRAESASLEAADENVVTALYFSMLISLRHIISCRCSDLFLPILLHCGFFISDDFLLILGFYFLSYCLPTKMFAKFHGSLHLPLLVCTFAGRTWHQKVLVTYRTLTFIIYY